MPQPHGHFLILITFKTVFFSFILLLKTWKCSPAAQLTRLHLCTDLNSYRLCHCCRFLVIWCLVLMMNGSLIWKHVLVSGFFTLLPIPMLLSLPSTPRGAATRPVCKDDLCYHQHPSKWIYSPTALLGWSASLSCLYSDTWLLTWCTP